MKKKGEDASTGVKMCLLLAQIIIVLFCSSPTPDSHHDSCHDEERCEWFAEQEDGEQPPQLYLSVVQ